MLLEASEKWIINAFLLQKMKDFSKISSGHHLSHWNKPVCSITALDVAFLLNITQNKGGV